MGEDDPQPRFPKGGNPRRADQVVVDLLNTLRAPLIPRYRAAVTAALARAPR